MYWLHFFSFPTQISARHTAGLSFTIVDMNLFVWLSDGNVRYLEGKHVPLFLVSVLFLFSLFIPYTLSITFGPWLQSKTRYKLFGWVLKLKPFFDSYFGPLKDKQILDWSFACILIGSLSDFFSQCFRR